VNACIEIAICGISDASAKGSEAEAWWFRCLLAQCLGLQGRFQEALSWVDSYESNLQLGTQFRAQLMVQRAFYLIWPRRTSRRRAPEPGDASSEWLANSAETVSAFHRFLKAQGPRCPSCWGLGIGPTAKLRSWHLETVLRSWALLRVEQFFCKGCFGEFRTFHVSGERTNRCGRAAKLDSYSSGNKKLNDASSMNCCNAPWKSSTLATSNHG
jgi:hypothetical protein